MKSLEIDLNKFNKSYRVKVIHFSSVGLLTFCDNTLHTYQVT